MFMKRIPPCKPPSIANVELPNLCKASSRNNIICVDQINTLIHQLPPDPISSTNRPARLVPIPELDALIMSNHYLSPQQLKLRAVQARARRGSEVSLKVCGRDRGDERGDVGERAVESWDWRVPEVVSACNWLDEVQGGVAGADYGHRTSGESSIDDGGEVAKFASGSMVRRLAFTCIRAC